MIILLVLSMICAFAFILRGPKRKGSINLAVSSACLSVASINMQILTEPNYMDAVLWFGVACCLTAAAANITVFFVYK